MSPLPDPRRLHGDGGAQRDPSDDAEHDPTGIRKLLAGLGDPGPMPEDLSQRITAALADERTRREAEMHGVVALSEHRERRRRSHRWVMPAAAAAAFVVVGGGLIMNGLFGVGGSDSTTAGGSFSAASVPGSPKSGAEAGTAESAPGQRGAGSAADTNPSLPLAPAASAAARSDGVVVSFSNQAYTKASLADAGKALREGQLPAIATMAAESPGVGPLATSTGARSCAGALGIPARTPVVVDLGTIDDEPGAVVVALGSGGEATAYAVGRYCTHGAPHLLAGPVRVA